MLLVVGALFVLAVVIHNGDHVRRGADSLDAGVFWLGTAAIALEVGLVVLVYQRHRLAPLAAAVAGLTLAAGYVLVHFLPEWGPFSDPLLGEDGIDGWSITAATIEVVAALALGAAGLVALRRSGGLASAARPRPEQRTARQGLLHPVVFVFALSQIPVLIVSFAQL